MLPFRHHNLKKILPAAKIYMEGENLVFEDAAFAFYLAYPAWRGDGIRVYWKTPWWTDDEAQALGFVYRRSHRGVSVLIQDGGRFTNAPFKDMWKPLLRDSIYNLRARKEKQRQDHLTYLQNLEAKVRKQAGHNVMPINKQIKDCPRAIAGALWDRTRVPLMYLAAIAIIGACLTPLVWVCWNHATSPNLETAQKRENISYHIQPGSDTNADGALIGTAVATVPALYGAAIWGGPVGWAIAGVGALIGVVVDDNN